MNTETTYLGNLQEFQQDTVSFDRYQWIPSVKYRQIISETVKPLKEITGIDFLCPTIVLNNGKQFYYTCTNPLLATAYSSTDLISTDKYFEMALQKNADYFYPRMDYPKNSPLQKTVVNILETKFKINNSYCLVKHCDDFSLVIGVGNSTPIDDLSTLYQHTYQSIENIIIQYFDKLMPLYIEQQPSLKYTRFASDAKFRKQVIQGNYRPENIATERLSPREIECLYWTSKGKLNAEIAIILALSEYTVTEHKKSIMKKLNANNMVNAVYKAVKAGIIS